VQQTVSAVYINQPTVFIVRYTFLATSRS